MDKVFAIIGLFLLLLIAVFILAVLGGYAGFSITNTETKESKKFGSCKEDE